MSPDDLGRNLRKPSTTDGESRVVTGPWENIPKPKRVREPIFNRRPRKGREPIINNWRILALFVLLLFVAPPLVRWASRIIMQLMFGQH